MASRDATLWEEIKTTTTKKVVTLGRFQTFFFFVYQREGEYHIIVIRLVTKYPIIIDIGMCHTYIHNYEHAFWEIQSVSTDSQTVVRIPIVVQYVHKPLVTGTRGLRSVVRVKNINWDGRYTERERGRGGPLLQGKYCIFL